MTQEALKKMYQLLLTEPHAPTVCAQLEVIAREALAQTQEPKPLPQGWNVVEVVGNITKVWHMTKEQITSFSLAEQPSQRTWVGLTDEEMQAIWDRYAHMEMMRAIEAKLKEKNNG